MQTVACINKDEVSNVKISIKKKKLFSFILNISTYFSAFSHHPSIFLITLLAQGHREAYPRCHWEWGSENSPVISTFKLYYFNNLKIKLKFQGCI